MRGCSRELAIAASFSCFFAASTAFCAATFSFAAVRVMGLQRGTRREGLVGGVRAQRGGQARQNVALFEPSVREVAAEHRLVARHGVARLRQLRRGCVARRHERIVCGRRALEGGGGECHAPNVARAEWPLPPRGERRGPVERVRRRCGRRTPLRVGAARPCGAGAAPKWALRNRLAIGNTRASAARSVQRAAPVQRSVRTAAPTTHQCGGWGAASPPIRRTAPFETGKGCGKNSHLAAYFAKAFAMALGKKIRAGGGTVTMGVMGG